MFERKREFHDEKAKCPECGRMFPVVFAPPSFAFDCVRNVLILFNNYQCDAGHKVKKWAAPYMYRLSPISSMEEARIGELHFKNKS